MPRLTSQCCLLATSVWLTGCPSQGIQAINASPEAAIVSHADGDTVVEGDLGTFLGVVSDPDHEAQDLLATWSLGEREICPAVAATEDGATSCQAVIGPDDTSLRLMVTDPKGAAGAAVITLVVTPTDAPTANILAPESTGIYYSDQLVAFEGLVQDAEDAAEDLEAWWESSLDGPLDVTAEPDSSGTVRGAGYLSQGEHAVTLHAQDSSGKTGTDSVIVTVGPPNSAPSCTITEPASGAVGAQGARVSFEAMVADADVPADWLQATWTSDKDGELGQSTPSSAGAVAFSWSDLSVATHTISLTVADEVGATCTDFVIYTVGTAPEVTLTSPGTGAVYNEGDAIPFSATVSDYEDSPSALSLTWVSDLDGTLSIQGADSSGLAQFSQDDLSAGEHTLTLTATDSDGLFGTAMVDFSINALPTAPTVGISPDPAVTTDTLVATASGSTDPDASGTVTYRYAWYEDGTLSSASSTSLFPASATTKGLTYRVVVTPSDGTGDGPTGEAEIVVGNASPVIAAAAISPSSGISTSTTLSCAASATDPDGDSPVLTYAWSDGGGASLGTGSSLTLSPTLVSPGSVIVCDATATDDEGAIASATDSVMVENSDPVVDSVAISPASGVTTSSTLTCSAAGSDPDGGSPTIGYAWANGSIALGTGSSLVLTPTTSAPGDSITCIATATDADGGSGTASASVVVENSAPIVEAVTISPTSGVTTSETLTCTATATDPDGGPPTLTYAWSDGAASLGAGSSLTLTPTTCAPSDTITCTAMATDADGGTGAGTASVLVVNSAPSVASATIMPDPAYAADTLTCAWSGFSDPDGDADASTVAWTVGGAMAGTGTTLAGAFVGGDTVVCTVTPFDGTDTGTLVSAILLITNSAPVLDEVTLAPDPAFEGDTLTCTPGLVADDDGEVVTYSYRWDVEGVDPGVTSAALSSVYFDRDETVTCTATPFDGTDSGSAVDSNSVTIANSVPSIAAVTISPTSPTAADTLTCAYSGYADADGDPDASTLAWAVNGTAAGSGSTLAGLFWSGDEVVCTVTPRDGTDAGVAGSATVTVQNEPPEVLSVSLSPTSVYTDDTLTASVSTADADGDAVTLSYAWYVDGGLVGATGSSLDGATWFDRDQVVYVVVTPNDGIQDGVAVASSSVTVLNTAPGAPTVSIEPEEPVEGEDDLVCVVDVESTDADGDAITYDFAWTVDGAAWGGSTGTTYRTGDTIAAADTAMDDVWGCVVMPGDGDDDGMSAEAAVIVLSSFGGGNIELSDADYAFIGEAAGDFAGRSVSSAGDVDGDGLDDILVGADMNDDGGLWAGKAYLVLGVSLGTDAVIDLDDADYAFLGEGADNMAGYSVSDAGDVDGDGLDDLLVGANRNSDGGSYAGKAYLVLGASLGADAEIDLSDADYAFVGEAAEDFAGWSVSSAGDMDGDGLGDILVAADRADDGGSDAGKTYLVLGVSLGADAVIQLSDADYSFAGEASGDLAGYSVSSAGDVDGDGLDDLLIGAHMNDDGGTDAGKAYLVLGASLGSDFDIDLSDADHAFIGEAAEDYAGKSVSGAGDVDGDGLYDLLVGASGNDDSGSWAGKAYLLLGTSLGADVEIELSEADYAFLGEGPSDGAGIAVSSAGDVDGDGLDDLLVGASGNDDGGSGAGKTYLVLGASLGADAEIELSGAEYAFIGEAASDYAGQSVSSAGDVDGDGLDDLLIGAFFNDDGGTYAGKAYLLLAGSL